MVVYASIGQRTAGYAITGPRVAGQLMMSRRVALYASAGRNVMKYARTGWCGRVRNDELACGPSRGRITYMSMSQCTAE